MQTASTVRVFGPASLSNLGPGFDALGLCISGLGDVVSGRLVDEPGVTCTVPMADAAAIVPTDPARNTAAVAAHAVLAQAGSAHGIHLELHKGIPVGSGIGGSAASAVAGAWCANLLLGHPFEKADLVDCVLEGEAVASGSRHGDNVLPALFGGMVLVSATEPARYRCVPLGGSPHVVLVMPEIEVLTNTARQVLPETVPLRDAVHNASTLAFLVDACRSGDWEAAGRAVMGDRLVEPVRARFVPCYEAVRAAALDAGAWGCALTGSGPALFALAPSERVAEAAVATMMEACRRSGIGAKGHVVTTDTVGVRELPATEP